MGFFSNQLCNVVEWKEYGDDDIFRLWNNDEIKKGSRLIIRPGQDAIFLKGGKIEGIFKDDGDYDIESQIIPFLSSLKGFKFGFNSGMRAEVLFVNTKEFTTKWGTKNAINIPAQVPGMPGGLPIRAFGTVTFKVNDYVCLIDKVAGVKETYTVEDVKIRVTSVLDQLLMKWISKEGKDMFNLQANSFDISNGIRQDLDMTLSEIGLTVTNFNVMSFTYPEEIQAAINKNASQSMIGDVNRYTQLQMADSLTQPGGQNNPAASTATSMAGMMVGMQMANQMMNNMNGMQNQGQPVQQPMQGGVKPNFCPNCGQKTGDSNFCPNCGQKLI